MNQFDTGSVFVPKGKGEGRIGREGKERGGNEEGEREGREGGRIVRVCCVKRMGWGERTYYQIDIHSCLVPAIFSGLVLLDNK